MKESQNSFEQLFTQKDILKIHKIVSMKAEESEQN